MANNVELGFDPIWSSFNLTGVAAGGAKLYSYQSLLPMLPQVIYQDAALTQPYAQPIDFDLNGNAPGPFYFVQDLNNPTNLYNLYLYDTDGNLIWNVNDYFPSSASSTPVTTSGTNLKNLVINNVFYRNFVSQASPVPATMFVAPGVNEGLVAVQDGNNLPAPDINFIKSNANATDTINFTLFTLGDTPFIDSPWLDVTPVGFINYNCSLAAAEAIKCLQIPITGGVQNLTSQPCMFSIWAKGNQPITLKLYQYFGAGSGSTSLINEIKSCALTSSWTKFTQAFTIPSVSMKSTGNCHNDGVFLQIHYPTNQTCDISIALPSMYLGTELPLQDFTIYDSLNGVIGAPRTGDVKISLNDFEGYEWVPMNDGSIGDSQSNGSVYHENDSFPLFSLIWNAFKQFDVGGINPIAQLYNSSGSTIAYGATAVDDYVAHNAISLTKMAGQVITGTYPLRNGINFTSQAFTRSGTIISVTTTQYLFTGAPMYFTSTGTLPSPLVANTIYYSILGGPTTAGVASTYAIALTGVPDINLTTNGTGTHTVHSNVLGATTGEYMHAQQGFEVGTHHHAGAGTVTGKVDDAGASGVSITASTPVTDVAVANIVTGNNVGGGSAMNIVQPSTFMNIFIKL